MNTSYYSLNFQAININKIIFGFVITNMLLLINLISI